MSDRPDQVPFEAGAVRDYLDGAIRSWRKDKAEAADGTRDALAAACYVDAFQSVRISLFGETLPVEDLPDPGRGDARG